MSCPLSTSRGRVPLPRFYTLTSPKVLLGKDSGAELCLKLLLRVCGEEWNVKDKETLVFIKIWAQRTYVKSWLSGCCWFVCFFSYIYNGGEEVEERLLLEKEFVTLGSMRQSSKMTSYSQGNHGARPVLSEDSWHWGVFLMPAVTEAVAVH